MDAAQPMATRYCSRCRTKYPIICFRRNLLSAVGKSKRHPLCKRCEITLRTNEKIKNRWLIKASGTIHRHAAKYKLPIKDFQRTYGWDKKQIAHDFEHASHNGCPYCLKLFSSMANGLSDLTLDIIDPSKGPYYRTNTKIVCNTCNQAKGAMDPTEFAIYQSTQQLWDECQRENIRNPWGPLFTDDPSAVITVT